MIRVGIGILSGAAAVYVLFLGGAYALMRQPPENFAAAIARVPGPLMFGLPFEKLWSIAREGDLQPGEMAPDFELERHDHTGRVRLSSYRGDKPVVLVFGSYT